MLHLVLDGKSNNDDKFSPICICKSVCRWLQNDFMIYYICIDNIQLCLLIT